ncbi:MAG: carbohydrate binding domain-containing protein [Eubacterium sp.]|nr:carbohydrate binding domain-containing protein [Eubacterium sp.]
MKYFPKSKCKAVLAAVLAALLICLCGCSQNAKNAQVNTVTDYNTEQADYKLSIDAAKEMHDISDLLFGIFFEDINFAADGGLYAEKIANRSFEFTELAAGNQLYGWNTVGDAKADVKINDTKNCLNENNTNYLVLANNGSEKAGIENVGFLDGISIEKDKKYNFSLYAKSIDNYLGPVTIRLVTKTQKNTEEAVAAEAQIDSITNQWAKYSLSFTSSIDANEGVTLQVLIDNGSAAFDMVSLFPADTYKGRKNGLRKDLATMLEELQPKFLRFPGGCVIEGYDDASDYSWKDSVAVGSDGLPLKFNGTYGDVAARKQGINIWTDIKATDDPWPSFMSYGLGFYEYFQFSEDIGAVGVPVLNCGLYCQGREGKPVDMKSKRFAEYIQDMLDLVEFCRGDASTTWGKVRANLGHKEPFELKYICIGNENYGKDYFERYKAFLDAFNAAKAKNPKLYKGIELIYSAGADDGLSGVDYLSSYEYAKKQLGSSKNAADFAGAVDQHYYNDPDWFFKNADYYDEANYKRAVDNMTDTVYGGAINVFLGEYASLSNTFKSALSEAAYMTGLERNGDIVRMATYAPLFGSTTAKHWAPNLIWFNNNSSIGSNSYYMQKLFSTNTGSKLLSSTLEGAAIEQKDIIGKVGVGTWYTSAEFDNVKIVNNDTGEVLGEDDFSDQKSFKKQWDRVTDGEWSVADGKLRQATTEMEYSENGSVVYFGEDDWSNYTFTVDAVKLDGQEGFLIPFGVESKETNYFWNIGGWNNTVSCLQEMNAGVKSGQLVGSAKPFVAETGKTYSLKVVVNGTNVQCYIDDELYVDYNTAYPAEAEAYQVVSTDESGDIIVKLVNVTDSARSFAVDISSAESIGSSAKVYQVADDSLESENILGEDKQCIMEEFTVSGFSNKFNYTVPKYSATVIRITK